MNFRGNISYLEDSDFNSAGVFKYPGRYIVMIYGDFCGHCHKMKPVFQAAADSYSGNVQWAAIQLDGMRASEKKLGERVQQIIGNIDFKGVPMVVMIENGRVSKEFQGPREKVSLIEFCS